MATAVQVESIWNGLTDNSGQPLAAGKVYTYSAGTSTPVSLYTASDKSSLATNPLILDGNGKAQVWADGRYKFVVKSSADVTLYTLDNLLYGFDDTTVLLGGTSTGSANAQTVSVPSTVESYSNGQRVTFIAGYTNTGATTLQFNSLAATNIVKGPSASSLQAGDLIAGQLYSCTYYGGSFRLENFPTTADIQRSRSHILSNVAGTNTITANATPALTGYEIGEVFRFKAINSSTSAATINIDSLGAKTIQFNNAALVSGEIGQNLWHTIVYDGTQFQLMNPANSASTRTLATTVAQIQDGAVIYGGTSTGSANAQAINLSPDITAYVAGQRFTFKAGFTNTGATTLAVDSITPAVAIQRFGTALVGGEIKLNDMVEVVYDGTQFQLCSSTPSPVFIDRTNNRLGLGTTAPTNTLSVWGAVPTTDLSRFSADTSGASLTLQKSRNTTLGSHTSVSSGDTLGTVSFTGSDGTNFITGASISALIDATTGTNDMPTALVFSTTADGASSATERMRITNAGLVGIGNTPTRDLTIDKTSTGDVLFHVYNRSNGNAARSGLLFGNDSNAAIASITLNSSTHTTGAGQLFYGNATSAGGHTFTTGAFTRMVIAGTGVVTMNAYGAGTATFSAAGVISSASDERLKIKDGGIENAQAKLQALNPGYWYWKPEVAENFGPQRELGFFAQNVNAAIGEEAAPTPEEGKTFGYYDRSVLAVTVQALKEVLGEIADLKARITALES